MHLVLKSLMQSVRVDSTTQYEDKGRQNSIQLLPHILHPTVLIWTCWKVDVVGTTDRNRQDWTYHNRRVLLRTTRSGVVNGCTTRCEHRADLKFVIVLLLEFRDQTTGVHSISNDKDSDNRLAFGKIHYADFELAEFDYLS